MSCDRRGRAVVEQESGNSLIAHAKVDSRVSLFSEVRLPRVISPRGHRAEELTILAVHAQMDFAIHSDVEHEPEITVCISQLVPRDAVLIRRGELPPISLGGS